MSTTSSERRRAPTDHVVPAKPLLPGFFRVIPMGPDAVQLRSTGRVYRVAGPDVGSTTAGLLGGLDGRSTVPELAARFGVDLDVVERLVGRLHSDGLVQDAAMATGGDGDQAPAPSSEFYAESGGDATRAQLAVSKSRVAFHGLGPVARMAASHLAAAGAGEMVLVEDGPLTPVDRALLAGPDGASRAEATAAMWATGDDAGNGGGGRVTFVASLDEVVSEVDLVVCEVDEAGSVAEAANRACLRAGVVLLPHELTTARAVVGPTVQPGSSCWECALERRLGHLRHVEEYLAFRDAVREGTVAARLPGVPAGALSIAAGLLSMEALRILAGFRPTTLGGVLVADLRTLEVVREEVLRMPGCPACDSGEEELILGS